VAINEHPLGEAHGEHASLVDVLEGVVVTQGSEPVLPWPIVSASTEPFPPKVGPRVNGVTAIGANQDRQAEQRNASERRCVRAV
jgi:hypothetical protein